MQITEPQLMSQAFAGAFNARDIEKLLSLYEPQALYVTRSSVEKGTSAIRAAFVRLFAVKGTIELTNDYCHVLDELALVRAEWRFTGSDANGQPIETHAHSSEVLRRQPNGTWRYAIDHPLGGD